MRRLYRGALPLKTRLELHERQKKCSTSELARKEWSSYRQSAPARVLTDELKRTAGARNRCFYCSDGRAADVDHYFPISRIPAKTFAWPNLQWVCPECNRSKSGQSPVVDGALLLDPTVDDPWGYLVLDSATGAIAARFRGDSQDERALATIRLFKALSWEPVIEGRSRSIRAIRDASQQVIENGSPESKSRLLRAVEEDDYGVARWFALWEGREEEPFRAVRTQSPKLWRRFVGLVVR